MQCRDNLACMILASVIVLVLTPMMVVVGAQARIAFQSDRDRNYEIYLMDDDGKNQQNLTNHPDSDDLAPAWSPDGTRIVFMSDRDGHVPKGGVLPNFEIYVIDADGGNQQNLTNNPSDDRQPAWSPDGKRIAFVSDRDGLLDIHGFPTSEIYVMDADGQNPQNLTNNRDGDWSPSWSPDGKRIVFMSYREGHFIGDFEEITSEIYVMDADGDNQQRLTENRKNDWSPSWSPDGTRIVFSSDRKGDFVNFEIYVMDADGDNQQRLTENRVYDWSPSWSPDGKRIAFSSDKEGHFKNYEIYVMDTDGGNPQQLTNHPRSDGNPAWFVPAFAVAPAGRKFTMWGRLKRVDR